MADYKEMARRSAEVRRARKRLLPTDVEAALGSLESEADAVRWLKVIAAWSAGGRIPGAVASALVRAVDVFGRLLEARASIEAVAELSQRLTDVTAERDGLASQV